MKRVLIVFMVIAAVCLTVTANAGFLMCRPQYCFKGADNCWTCCQLVSTLDPEVGSIPGCLYGDCVVTYCASH